MSKEPEEKFAAPTPSDHVVITNETVDPNSLQSHASSVSVAGSLSRYLRKTDQGICHLSNILSTPSGTDTLLLTICYTSLLSSTILTSISLARLRNTARLLIKNILELSPETTVLLTTTTIPTSRLLKLSVRLKALSSLISDVRIFARLWGLLGIWRWGKVVLVESPDDDVVLRKVKSVQVLANVAYQYLENYAYLSGKGILGWSQETQAKAWTWSSRFWAMHVMLEFVCLWRKRVLRKETGKYETEDEINDWNKQILINVAYAPLTLHWSIEKGLVSEFWVGLLGSIVGAIKTHHIWNRIS